jgi:hypothetical protein
MSSNTSYAQSVSSGSEREQEQEQDEEEYESSNASVEEPVRPPKSKAATKSTAVRNTIIISDSSDEDDVRAEPPTLVQTLCHHHI